MKFLVERDALRDAISVVVGRTKGTNIPILSHILMATEGNAARLLGHDLDCCSEITISAEVFEQGRMAIPGDRLAKLVAGLPAGSQVHVEAGDIETKLRCGRSTYRFPILRAENFPDPLSPKSPATFTLTAKQVGRLFGTPEVCICSDASRFYLAGIFLHTVDRRLAACATNGHTLLRAVIDVEPPKFNGVIVPEKSCREIVRLVGQGEATIEVSDALIAAQADGRRFVSKLIDGTLPDYARVIPSATAPTMTFMTQEIDAALGRLTVAGDAQGTPPVKFTWQSGDLEGVVASSRSQDGVGGEEQVDCDGRRPETGEVGAQISYLRAIIEALGGERVRLFIDGPGDPIRVENPDDKDLVAVVMPCRV